MEVLIGGVRHRSSSNSSSTTAPSAVVAIKTTAAAALFLMLCWPTTGVGACQLRGDGDWILSACREQLTAEYCEQLRTVEREETRAQPDYNLTEGVVVFNWFSQAYGSCPHSSLSFYPCTIRGVVCDAEGRVTEISAGPCMNELEPLPMEPSVAQLERLQWLRLEGNLRGSLPECWTKLTRLQSLEIDGSITGTLPSVYSRLASLQRVVISASALSGTLPASWSELSNLTALELTNNSGIVGTLPPQYSVLNQRLRYFTAADSKLTGTMPAAFSELTSIQSLILERNNLTGTIPEQWSELKHLVDLSLVRNQLSGTLPLNFFNSSMRLQKLAVSYNGLTGTLPREWSSARFLNRLGLGRNLFTGQLPEEWSALFYLGFIDVANNQLTGSIPSSWSTMVFLSELYLNSNELTGTLPMLYGNFLRIRDMLKLEGNKNFSGHLPEQWSLMNAITHLSLGGSLVSGSLPMCYSTWKDVERVELDANQLTGSLPPTLSTWTDLKELNLGNNNHMRGSLPDQYSTWAAMKELKLNNCTFSGQLPGTWSTMKAVEAILLDQTALSGTVPHSWSMLDELKLLAVPPALCDTIESDFLWEAATNNSYPGTCAPRESNLAPRIALVVTLGCVAAGALLALFVLGLAVCVHRHRCGDPQCAHRHPGLAHALVGHLAPGIRSAACPWCMWDGKPDLSVPFDEIQPLLVPEAIVGRGGFSKVYRGDWRGRPVAVKLLDVCLTDNGVEQCRALANEVDVCVRCNECPRMVRLYGACLERFCIISEFVDGGTLDERIHGKGDTPMTLLEVLQVVRDIAEGLAFLHPQLVHRDLKPLNVLLHRSGRAKIIDFGLGRVNDNPLRTHASTHAAGTAAYMSPEQCEGQVSPKVDIYALGVILNECLSREIPFQNYSNPMQVQVAVSIRQERPKLAADCSKAVRSTIERCWHTEPAKRPTAKELVFILDHLIQAEIGLREQSDASTHPDGANATTDREEALIGVLPI